MKVYDDSKTFIVDEKLEQYVKEIKTILTKEMPYSDIPKLPNLIEKFEAAYTSILSKMESPVLAAIEDARSRVYEVLDTKSYKDEFQDRFVKLFKEIWAKANTCENVATLQNIKVEADALKVRLLNEMAKKDEEIAGKIYDEVGDGSDSKKPRKKRKSISIKSVSLSSSWQIEFAQDLDQYITTLKEQILKELDPDTIISIEL